MWRLPHGRASCGNRPGHPAANSFTTASAIVPLLVTEATTTTMQALAEKDLTMLVWWATEVECASAIARLERDGAVDQRAVAQAFDRLKHLAQAWHEVDPSDPT